MRLDLDLIPHDITRTWMEILSNDISPVSLILMRSVSTYFKELLEGRFKNLLENAYSRCQLQRPLPYDQYKKFLEISNLAPRTHSLSLTLPSEKQPTITWMVDKKGNIKKHEELIIPLTSKDMPNLLWKIPQQKIKSCKDSLTTACRHLTPPYITFLIFAYRTGAPNEKLLFYAGIFLLTTFFIASVISPYYLYKNAANAVSEEKFNPHGIFFIKELPPPQEEKPIGRLENYPGRS